MLVGGGDMMLAAGAGDPAAIEGHAGLADLAAQTAKALQLEGATTVELGVDDSLFTGPDAEPALEPGRHRRGVRRARHRARRRHRQDQAGRVPAALPGPVDRRGQDVRAAAGRGGITVDGHALRGPTSPRRRARDRARSQSATLDEIVHHFLDTSDNTITEVVSPAGRHRRGPAGELRRRRGGRAARGGRRGRRHGRRAPGRRVRPRARARCCRPACCTGLVRLATDPAHPNLRDVATGMPIGGLTGTLCDRYTQSQARGLVRAKTGSLPHVTSLSGTVLDADVAPARLRRCSPTRRPTAASGARAPRSTSSSRARRLRLPLTALRRRLNAVPTRRRRTVTGSSPRERPDASSTGSARRRSRAARDAGPTAERGELDERSSTSCATPPAARRGTSSRITGLEAADGTDAGATSRTCSSSTGRAGRRPTRRCSRVMTGRRRRRPRASGARAAGAVQVGGVLALLSSKVLGQFDPFTPRTAGRGRLLLVAPNVLHHERELEVDPSDFRLWVALHEQTHALQFAAAPVAAPSTCAARAARAPGGPDRPTSLAPRVGELLQAVSRAVAGRVPTTTASACSTCSPPRQREVFEEVGAVMALLEGHADVTMDEVGPPVVPTVAHDPPGVRGPARRGAPRRTGSTGCCAGCSASTPSSRSTATAPRSSGRCARRSGLDGLQRGLGVGRTTCPRPQEIADPRAWVRRVHG